MAALAETINGLYKAEVIHRRAWPTHGAVELATLMWIDWFNHRRLVSSIGNTAKAAEQKQAALLKPNSLRDSRDGSTQGFTSRLWVSLVFTLKTICPS